MFQSQYLITNCIKSRKHLKLVKWNIFKVFYFKIFMICNNEKEELENEHKNFSLT